MFLNSTDKNSEVYILYEWKQTEGLNPSFRAYMMLWKWWVHFVEGHANKGNSGA